MFGNGLLTEQIGYFRSLWNIFDFLIIISGTI